jgi:hypothetical protein
MFYDCSKRKLFISYLQGEIMGEMPQAIKERLEALAEAFKREINLGWYIINRANTSEEGDPWFAEESIFSDKTRRLLGGLKVRTSRDWTVVRGTDRVCNASRNLVSLRSLFPEVNLYRQDVPGQLYFDFYQS